MTKDFKLIRSELDTEDLILSGTYIFDPNDSIKLPFKCYLDDRTEADLSNYQITAQVTTGDEYNSVTLESEDSTIKVIIPSGLLSKGTLKIKLTINYKDTDGNNCMVCRIVNPGIRIDNAPANYEINNNYSGVLILPNTLKIMKYLTLIAKEDGRLISKSNTTDQFYISKDLNEWTELSKTDYESASSGDRIYLRGILAKGSYPTHHTIGLEGNWTISGDIRYLNDYNNPDKEIGEACFSHLFSGSDISDASGLIIPYDSIPVFGMRQLFSNCKLLTRKEQLPKLPANEVLPSGYELMFNNCTSLVSAPELPATELTNQCYNGMFSGCTSLVNAPALPVTILADSCYGNMFSGCTSLTNAPELPAIELATSCYGNMFSGCTSLTNAPELPAIELATSCYNRMFNRCTSLVNAPALPATILSSFCYQSMFSGCTSLVNAPALPATILSSFCYQSMFSGCTSLVDSPALPATILSDYCYQSMFEGCTSLTEAPVLPATELHRYCYKSMFNGCTGLIYAPELLATTLSENCYQSMFEGCISLTEAPVLSARTLDKDCYTRMFYGCTLLNRVTCLATDKIQSYYYQGYTYYTTDKWLDGVASNGTFIKDPSVEVISGTGGGTHWGRSTNGIPLNWVVEDYPE